MDEDTPLGDLSPDPWELANHVNVSNSLLGLINEEFEKEKDKTASHNSTYFFSYPPPPFKTAAAATRPARVSPSPSPSPFSSQPTTNNKKGQTDVLGSSSPPTTDSSTKPVKEEETARAAAVDAAAALVDLTETQIGKKHEDGTPAALAAAITVAGEMAHVAAVKDKTELLDGIGAVDAATKAVLEKEEAMEPAAGISQSDADTTGDETAQVAVKDKAELLDVQQATGDLGGICAVDAATKAKPELEDEEEQATGPAAGISQPDADAPGDAHAAQAAAGAPAEEEKEEKVAVNGTSDAALEAETVAPATTKKEEKAAATGSPSFSSWVKALGELLEQHPGAFVWAFGVCFLSLNLCLLALVWTGVAFVLDCRRARQLAQKLAKEKKDNGTVLNRAAEAAYDFTEKLIVEHEAYKHTAEVEVKILVNTICCLKFYVAMLCDAFAKKLVDLRATTDKELEDLRKERSLLQSKLDTTTSKLEKSEEDCCDARLDAIKAKNALASQNAAHQTSLEKLKKKHAAALTSQQTTSQAELQHLKGELLGVQGQLAAAQASQQATSQAELLKVQGLLAARTDELARNQKQLGATQAELAAGNDRFTELLKAAGQRAKQLEASKKALAKAHAMAQAKEEEDQKMIQRLKEEAADAGKAAAKWVGENEKLQAQLRNVGKGADTTAEVQALKQEIAARDAKLAELDKEMDEAYEQDIKLKAFAAEAQQRLMMVVHREDALKVEVKALQKQLATAEAAMVSSTVSWETEHARLKAEKEQLQALLGGKEEEVAALQAAASSTTTTMEETVRLETEVWGLKALLMDKEEELVALKAQVSTTTNALSRLGGMAGTLKTLLGVEGGGDAMGALTTVVQAIGETQEVVDAGKEEAEVEIVGGSKEEEEVDVVNTARSKEEEVEVKAGELGGVVEKGEGGEGEAITATSLSLGGGKEEEEEEVVEKEGEALKKEAEPIVGTPCAQRLSLVPASSPVGGPKEEEEVVVVVEEEEEGSEGGGGGEGVPLTRAEKRALRMKEFIANHPCHPSLLHLLNPDILIHPVGHELHTEDVEVDGCDVLLYGIVLV